jgi:vacuolar-type H+-ATPase catalytic subunit A/Vma1
LHSFSSWFVFEVVVVDNMGGTAMSEIVKAGHRRLLGEVITLKGNKATVQVFEGTGKHFPCVNPFS